MHILHIKGHIAKILLWIPLLLHMQHALNVQPMCSLSFPHFVFLLLACSIVEMRAATPSTPLLLHALCQAVWKVFCATSHLRTTKRLCH